ncbi:MAG: hypothetical protein FWB91_14295 [Defluviitaleaceae bacterium]|nr:hypothetical protein [Defluviitaleaceae bacterium]
MEQNNCKMEVFEILDELKALRKRIIDEDIETLRDAAFVLEREGKTFQRDLFERITAILDAMSPKKTPHIPKPFDAKPQPEYNRKYFYDKINQIRSTISDEKIKRELYIMTWEISDAELEDLLLLFREAMVRFAQRHKNIFTEPPGIREIQYNLAKLGIMEVIPQGGDEFDPAWHLHSSPQKTGFDYRISKTIHPGYKRNGRRLLKAIVEVL